MIIMTPHQNFGKTLDGPLAHGESTKTLSPIQFQASSSYKVACTQHWYYTCAVFCDWHIIWFCFSDATFPFSSFSPVYKSSFTGKPVLPFFFFFFLRHVPAHQASIQVESCFSQSPYKEKKNRTRSWQKGKFQTE